MRAAYLLVLGVSLALPACGGSAKELRLTFTPAADMNGARSCYVLTRAIDGQAFSTETYDDVAGKAMAPDDSVLSAVAVLPGVKQELKVPLAEKGRMAIYALFKQPEDEGWRLLLPEEPPPEVEIRLDRGRMCWTSDDAPKEAAGVCKQRSDGR
jgi:predicted component of type VI protein secretion system